MIAVLLLLPVTAVVCYFAIAEAASDRAAGVGAIGAAGVAAADVLPDGATGAVTTPLALADPLSLRFL